MKRKTKRKKYFFYKKLYDNMSCLMLNMHEYFFNSHIHEFHDFDDMQALA